MKSSRPEGLTIGIEKIDFSKLAQVGNKIMDFVFQKIDEPLEIYLLLKMLCFSFEEVTAVKLDPKDEILLRKMLK